MAEIVSKQVTARVLPGRAEPSQEGGKVRKVFITSPDSVTWANGDTIVWQTHPAAGAVYLDWVIPAGAEAIDNNRFTVVFTGYRA